MELPLFRQITITKSNQQSIAELIDNLNFNNYPAYITISPEFNYDETTEIINTILQYLDKNDINYKLPFPLYIVTSADFHETSSIIHKSTNDLPRYFRVSRKNPNQREQQILRRITILREQLSAISITDKLNLITKRTKNDQLIKNNSNTIEFYATIIKEQEKIHG
jgi:hypothetical protein